MSSQVSDARISIALPDHPKTVKLVRRCGEAGAWAWSVCSSGRLAIERPATWPV